MARRQITEDPVNHERWIISYADFITLLFAFFVVMYSISQVNEGKYRALSETLTHEFKSPNQYQLRPPQAGERTPVNPLDVVSPEGLGLEVKPLPEEFQVVADQVTQRLGSYLETQQANLRGNEEWLEIELDSSLLFGSGDAELSNQALELLGELAELFKGSENPVRVEGFTDNVPIATAQFPSNWELSAARASAVVQLFIEEGIDPSRLAAVGYGEHQPIADNSTPEGRAKNRRVVLMMAKHSALRPTLEPLYQEESPVQNTPERDEAAVPEKSQDSVVQPKPVRTIGDGLVTAPESVSEQADRMMKDLLGVEALNEAAQQLNEERQGRAQGANEAKGERGNQGVRQLQLEGGGVLFTADPESQPR